MGWNQQPQLESAVCIVQYGFFGDLCRSANCSGRQGAGRHARQKYRQMNLVRWWYYSYYLLFYCFATAVGLLSRLYFGETSGFDPEMALPNMARDLLPPWLAGLMLAGIFAATMSTADSLVLSFVCNHSRLAQKTLGESLVFESGHRDEHCFCPRYWPVERAKCIFFGGLGLGDLGRNFHNK